ncbi:MAG: hypothetical protein QME57_05390, partial [Patescibacteria group bacterium]|nr:hypothetical protein [Patescibacteria group bacterium]
SVSKKKELEKIYQSLNLAQLKRTIDRNLDILWKTYQQKNKLSKVKLNKKFKPFLVRNYVAQPEPLSVR